MKILEILATSLAVRSSTIWLSLLGAVGGGDIMADLVSMGHVFIIESSAESNHLSIAARQTLHLTSPIAACKEEEQEKG